MKKIILWILISFSFLSFFSDVFALDIFTNTNEIIYCKDGDECSLWEWTEIVKTWINDINKTDTTSVYVQKIVIYLLTFISILAVIYIIYAGFKILISWWNEDDVKKSKTTIISVLIWIIIIWLAYSIVAWIIKLVTI